MLASPHADAAVLLELDGRGNSGTAGSSPKDTFFEPQLALSAEDVDDDADSGDGGGGHAGGGSGGHMSRSGWTPAEDEALTVLVRASEASARSRELYLFFFPTLRVPSAPASSLRALPVPFPPPSPPIRPP